jgi:malto-oligosyltrehalose trehalohydrolase
MGEQSLPIDLSFGPDTDDLGTVFRLWAPSARRVELVIHRGVPPVRGGELLEAGTSLELVPDSDGWCRSERLPLGAGSRYRYRIDRELEVPDPASRFQPQGVHGPSEVVDLRQLPGVAGPARSGRAWEETVLYELHVGAFSPEGSYSGVTDRLGHLEELGVTAAELMPIAAFPGERNWGYDGVLPYAPAAPYGTPEELSALLRSAQQRGVELFLDVVYNHFGPEGNYLHLYAKPFFTERFKTPWGAAIDFSLPEVRAFFLENALYWTLLYGFDGLRIDAVHAIRDDSSEHFVEELARRVKEEAKRVTPGRQVHVVLENEENEAHRLESATAQWNDDVHHLVHVLLTGEDEGYYCDYQRETHRALGKTLAEGFYFQGEPSIHRDGAPRGTPSRGLHPARLVAFSHNHDQIGNRAMGERPTTLASGPDVMEAVEALILLSPQTPMLFMGEEWGSEKPFLFFCDYEGELAQAVREGRRREFAGFSAFEDEAARERIPDPNAQRTFEVSRLDWSWRTEEQGSVGRGDGDPTRYQCIRRLLTLRREWLQPHLREVSSGSYEGAEEEAMRVRWPMADGRRWALYYNLTATVRSLPDYAPPTSSTLVYPGEVTEPAPGVALDPWTVIVALEED